MVLDLPTPGKTPGPEWAFKVNKALEELDENKIGPEGIGDALATELQDPESAASVQLSATMAGVAETPRRIGSPGGGAILLSMDDAYIAMRTVADWMTARGQRGTFCITPGLMNGSSKIDDDDILAMHAAGHEIGSHTMTHPNLLVTSTPAERVEELEDSKAYLEALIGAPVTTFAYPNGVDGRDATTDATVYPIYDRVLNAGGHLSTYPRYMEPPALIPRLSWTSANHDQALATVRQAAESPVLGMLYFHNVDTENNPTSAQVQALLDLCVTLGVPLITTREAFGSFHMIANPSFESGERAPWTRHTRDSGTAEVVTVTPAVGVTGSKAIELTIGAASTSFAYVRQVVPVTPWRSYRLTGLGRWVSGATGNKSYLRVSGVGPGYEPIIGETYLSPELTAAEWSESRLDYTAGAGVAYAIIDVVLTGPAGSAVAQWDQIYHQPLNLPGSSTGEGNIQGTILETVGSAELRRNYNRNPKMTASTFGWTTGGSTSFTDVDADGIEVTLSSSTSGGALLLQNQDLAVAEGDLWASSIEITVPVGATAITVQLRSYAYGQNAVIGRSPQTLISPGQTVRLAAPAEIAATSAATGVRTILYAVGTIDMGAKFRARWALAEKAPTPGDYFDGDTSANTYWTGTEDQSPSGMAAPDRLWSDPLWVAAAQAALGL